MRINEHGQVEATEPDEAWAMLARLNQIFKTKTTISEQERGDSDEEYICPEVPVQDPPNKFKAEKSDVSSTTAASTQMLLQ